jgi:hypothetical protein
MTSEDISQHGPSLWRRNFRPAAIWVWSGDECGAALNDRLCRPILDRHCLQATISPRQALSPRLGKSDAVAMLRHVCQLAQAHTASCDVNILGTRATTNHTKHTSCACSAVIYYVVFLTVGSSCQCFNETSLPPKAIALSSSSEHALAEFSCLRPDCFMALDRSIVHNVLRRGLRLTRPSLIRGKEVRNDRTGWRGRTSSAYEVSNGHCTWDRRREKRRCRWYATSLGTSCSMTFALRTTTSRHYYGAATIPSDLSHQQLTNHFVSAQVVIQET